MTEAGADILVAHMGLTTSGSIGAKTAKTLEESVRLIDAIADAAKIDPRRRDRALPRRPDRRARATPQYILQHCRAVDGFYGASSMERLPTERAIREQTERFMSISRRQTNGEPS